MTPATHATPAEITCLRCGYNLTGLSADQRCPECGTPIERSLHGDLLRYADDTYLHNVWIGTQGVILFLGLHALLTFVSCSVPVLSLLGVPGNMGTFYKVQSYIWFAFALGMLAATWLQSVRDPGQLSQYRGERLRFALRGCLGLQAFGSLLSALAVTFPQFQAASGVVTTYYWSAAVALFVSQNLYMIWLVRRIPSDRLATSLRMLIIFGCGVLMLSFVSWLAILIASSVSGGMASIPPRFWSLYTYSRVPLSLLSIATAVWQIAAYSKAAREFAIARAASRAERHAPADQPPPPV